MILIWFFSLIFVLITYQLFMSCSFTIFLFWSVSNYQNVPINLLDHVIGCAPFIPDMVIVENSGTPFRNMISIYCGYYYYDLIPLFYPYIYYFLVCFHSQIYFRHKNNKQHRRDTTLHTGSTQWTQEQFEGNDNWWEKDLVSIGNRPILLWISWCSTVTNQF